MKKVLIVLAVLLAAGFVAGCTSTKPVAKTKAPVTKVAVVSERQTQLSALREVVVRTKTVWQADPKNAAKRQAYDDAVAAYMEKVGKAK